MSQSDEFPEVREIADAICDSEATPEQMQKLEALLRQSEAAQLFYIDYIGLHAHMKAGGDPNLEVVMRRSQIDELIVRPAGSDDLGAALGTPHMLEQGNTTSSNQHKFKNILLFCLLSICLGLIAYIATLKKENSFGTVQQGRLKDLERHSYPENIQSGEYLAEEDTFVLFSNSSKLKVNTNSRFNLSDPNRIFFNRGQLKFIQESHESLKLSTSNFKLISNSKLLNLQQSEESSVIQLNSDNEYYPKRWRPSHYWSFDFPSDRALDSAGDSHGTMKGKVERKKGLLGQGSFYFTNTNGSGIDLGNGGGTTLATGSFACIDGVSIEALIQPEYSGKPRHHDDIFRKDMADGQMRMLLAFQNDGHKKYAIPQDYPLPALAFGLYLIGHNYHELKLPLDGKDGRPTLAELKSGSTHHVVASYDVRSGLKGIYLDGKLLAHHNYPPGTKMVSGGSGSAMVGNFPGKLNEPFSGTIDEVAFYNFALPSYMVQKHYANFKQGLNYYGLKPGSKVLPDVLKLKLPPGKEMKLDTLTGLPVGKNINPLN